MKKLYLKQLFVAMVALLCSVTMSAHDFEVDGIFYNINDNEANVTCKGDSWDHYENEYSGYVIIPQVVTYNGKKYSVTSIGDYAFSECSGLQTVEIPNSVKKIGDWAFDNSGITWITIPNSVTSIGECAFYRCYWLHSIEIGNSVKTIGNYAFRTCRFSGIKIPNSVISIGFQAFYNCWNLASVEIPNSVKSIGGLAFADCNSLKRVTIPNSVTNIGDDAFSDCRGLTKVILNCDSIGNWFRNTSIKEIELGGNVTSIGERAFSYCSGLTSITIPNSVTSIGKWAFSYCTGLTSITIPNSVTSIEERAFSYCSGLTSVTIPNSVTSIGTYAFSSCSGLTSITSHIPAEKLFAINSNVFNYVDKNNCTLYVPIGTKATYATTDGWKEFNNIVEFDPTSIEDVTEDVPTFEVTAGGIQLTTAEGKVVAVYTTSGALVEKIDTYAGEEIMLDKGVYIIRVGGKTVKVRL